MIASVQRSAGAIDHMHHGEYGEADGGKLEAQGSTHRDFSFDNRSTRSRNHCDPALGTGFASPLSSGFALSWSNSRVHYLSLAHCLSLG